MPMMGMGNAGAAVQVERDHSPLPEVEAGLFDDFSFGGSVSASGSMSGAPEGDVMSHAHAHAHGADGVDPMGQAADAGVDPVTSSSTPSTHESSLYSGSPPLNVAGLPDMTHFEHHHQQPPHQQHHHLGMDGMGDMLDMSAYGMYADVDPIERSIGMGAEGMKVQDGYFEGVGGGVYEV